MRITFLSRSLEVGGAERQLALTARYLHDRGHAVEVLVFYPGGALEEETVAAGIPVRSLEKSGRWDIATFLARLQRAVRRSRPDVLYSFLPVPNILTALLKPFLGGPRLAWAVRCSDMDLSLYDRLSRLSYQLEALLAGQAHLIIANSEAGRREAVARGFPDNRLDVIPNGVDISRFRLDAEAGLRQRVAWGIGPGEPVIGMVARLDPIKDYPTFIAAAAALARRRPDAKFVCVGDGSAATADILRAQTTEAGLVDNLVWAGPCQDMTAAYNALDVAVLTSRSEGFPNVLAEAMACGRPCVSTHVGDAADIIGPTGRVVPIGAAEAIAEACLNLLTGDTDALAAACRARIVDSFSLQAQGACIEQRLLTLLGQR